MPDAYIRVDKLKFAYDRDKPVLQDISFELKKGECLGVIGLNGSGKTTLCYCLGGIIPNYYRGWLEGTVIVNGKNTAVAGLQEIAVEVGIVLQDPNDQILMPTVEDEIAFSLENNRFPPETMAVRIREVLEQVGLKSLSEEDPNRLSGGEKQLLVIAAVLALEPPILVFDESLSMLDEYSCRRILDVLANLKKLGKTMVIVDHTRKSLHLLDRVLVLEQGRVIYAGSPQALAADQGFQEEHHLAIL